MRYSPFNQTPSHPVTTSRDHHLQLGACPSRTSSRTNDHQDIPTSSPWCYKLKYPVGMCMLSKRRFVTNVASGLDDDTRSSSESLPRPILLTMKKIVFQVKDHWAPRLGLVLNLQYSRYWLVIRESMTFELFLRSQSVYKG